MCIVGLALKAHEDFPVIIAANRDESPYRPSKEPRIHDDGVLCGEDEKFKGTWMGLNTEHGLFVGVTNTGNQRTRTLSRGTLVAQFLRNIGDTANNLKGWKRYAGFNLFWGNLFSMNPTFTFTSNCQPQDQHKDDTKDLPTLSTISEPGIYVIGNDLMDDEFVKAPYLKQRMKNVISANPPCRDSKVPSSTVDRLAVGLGDMLCEQPGLNELPLIEVLSKFFYFSESRRKQPGLLTALALVRVLLPVLLVCAWLIWGFSMRATVVSAVLAALVSFGLGFMHHLRMQHLFVWIPIPHSAVAWGTISQTIVITTKDERVFYYFRSTVKGKGKLGAWRKWELSWRK